MSEKSTVLDAYLAFRKEIDIMFFTPFAARNRVLTTKDDQGNVIALLIVEPYADNDYIDCLWVAPKHRREGVGQALVKQYIDTCGMPNQLRILNNNEVAKKFWNKIFNLRVAESNPYDTLYWIESRNVSVAGE